MVPFQDYQNIIDEIRIYNLIPEKYKLDIVVDDFRGLDIEDEFQKSFNFYQGNIIKHYKYGIEPGIFFFNTNISLNAFAVKWNDHFVISFNKGTKFFILNKFKLNNDILNVDGLEEFVNADNKSDYPINELMSQICGHYIFYHELGHLIQKPESLTEMMTEAIFPKVQFSLMDHILEYDADLFSALCLGAHLYQYIEKWCPEASDEESEMIISAVIGSIFLLLLSFPSAKKDIYFEEQSHPHPFIRVVGILYSITDYIELLSKKKKSIKLDKTKMIKQALFVAEKVAPYVLDVDNISKFRNSFIVNERKIFEYNQKLQKEVQDLESSAYNRRNNSIN